MIYSIDCSVGTVTFSGGVFGCTDSGVVSATPVAYAVDTTNPDTNFSDGMSLGWGVVAAMAAAWAVVVLRKALMR